MIRKWIKTVLAFVIAACVCGTADGVTITGSINFNTETGTYTGDVSGSGTITGDPNTGYIATFTFDGFHVLSGATVTIAGPNSIEIISTSDITIDSLIDVSGNDAPGNMTGAAGRLGGWAGGNVGAAGAVGYDGDGPGGGQAGAVWYSVGGGGGYGGVGGTAPNGGMGGTTYGSVSVFVLQGGSGGAGSGGHTTPTNSDQASGAAGGGAIKLKAAGNIIVNGTILAQGGNGYDTTDIYTGAGGSGGAIVLDAVGSVTINAAALLSVSGGHGGNHTGGNASGARTGGGGGGGRIAIFGSNLIVDGVSQSPGVLGSLIQLDVSGGAGGTGPIASRTGAAGSAGTVFYGLDSTNPKATLPEPQNGQTGLPVNIQLGWLSGAGAVSHDVYIGTNPTLGVGQYQGNQTETTFDLAGIIEPDMTYYWRIDEIDSASNTTTGDVWSFSTGKKATAIYLPTDDVQVNAYGSSTNYDGLPLKVSSSSYSKYSYIKFTLSGVNQLSGYINTITLKVRAISDIPDIEVSQVSGSWQEETLTWNSDNLIWGSSVGAITSISAGQWLEYDVTGVITGDGEYTFGLKTTGTSDYELNSKESVYPPVLEIAYNTDVWMAYKPIPSDEADGVSIVTDLSWTAGQGAVYHDVYLGTAPDILAYEDRVSTDTYDPGLLVSDTTYYWRVDPLDASQSPLGTGELWSFTTKSHASIPRFIAYEGFDYSSGFDPEGYRIGDQGTGGSGWGDRWKRGNGDWVYAKVRTDSLVCSFYYPFGTEGNRLQHNNINADKPNGPNDGDVQRQLLNPIDLTVDIDYYVSFFVMATDQTWNQGDLEFRVTREGVRSFGCGIIPSTWSGGDPNIPTSTPKFYLRGVDGATVTSGGSWQSNDVYLVALKISASSIGDDIVYMNVYGPSDTLPTEAPTSWMLSVSGTSDESSLAWLKIVSQHADLWDQVAWDEVRIGTTWGSVTGWPDYCGDLGTLVLGDLNGNCHIDMADLSIVAIDWIRCSDPGVAGCEVATDSDPQNIADLLVMQTDGTVSIDADLGEWTNAQWFSVSKTDTGNTDDVVEAMYALAWNPSDPNALYVAGKVIDTDHRFLPTPSNSNVCDNFEMLLEANGTGTTNTAWYTTPTYNVAQAYRVAYDGTSGSWASWKHYVADGHAVPANNPDSKLIYAAAIDPLDSDTILYEAALQTFGNFGGFDLTTTTWNSLVDSGVIRFSVQVNTLSSSGTGTLIPVTGQKHFNPSTWPEYTVKANASLQCGDWGYFEGDVNPVDCSVDIHDLAFIVGEWLTCTDPQDPMCDKPWLP